MLLQFLAQASMINILFFSALSAISAVKKSVPILRQWNVEASNYG